MTPSPLLLERHFFSRVLLEAHPDGQPDLTHQLHCEEEIGKATDTSNRFQVVIRLKLLSPEGKKAGYTGEIHAVGLFRVVDKWPKDKVEALVEANGAALLYGAIRELVINLTSRGPWPAVVLNAVTFIRPKQKHLTASGAEYAVAKS